MTIGAKNGCGSLAPMENGLEHLLDPACVAVVGASEDLGKFGGRALHNLIDDPGPESPSTAECATVFG